MMRYNYFVSYTSDRDVHTALHMAGAQATDLITVAVREYIERHNHPAGLAEVQTRAALDGLAINGTGEAAGNASIGRVPAPVIEAMPALREQPAPVPVPVPVSTPAVNTNSRSASTLMAFAFSQLDDA